MQLIRKILKANLNKLESTRDIILSITESDEIFVNDSSGNHKKITDIIVVKNTTDFSGIVPIPGKFYFIKETRNFKYYVDTEIGYISVTEVIDKAIETINEQITNLGNSIDTLNTNLSNEIKTVQDALNDAITDLEASIKNVADSNSSLGQTIQTHTNEISAINIALTNLDTAVTSVKNRMDALELANTGINNNISSLREDLTTLEGSVDTLDGKFTTVNNTVGNHSTLINDNKTAIDNANTEIEAINASMLIKNYNAVYDVEKLKAIKIEPEIFVPAYIFNTTERMYITELSLRSRTQPVEAITFELKYIPEMEDGSVGNEITIDEITLPAGSYKVNKKLNVTFADNEGIRNGYINVYVKDPGASHEEATFMVNLCVRNPIIEVRKPLT